MNNKIKYFLLLVGVCLFSSTANAGNISSVTESERSETVEASEAGNDNSLFPDRDRKLSESHFTWGAEFGTSIDVSGYDTSTFDLDVVFGYKNSYFRILGLGAGVHRSLGSGDNFVPLYAVARTSFSTRPRLFFMSLKAGYSFNTMGDSPTYGDISAAVGAGINLAVSRHFKTHIILGYEFRHFNQKHRHALSLDSDDISLATLSFGINF